MVTVGIYSVEGIVKWGTNHDIAMNANPKILLLKAEHYSHF